ncbi:unnamed protein product [Timema podura]|uniref:C2H2-type domain-containing protein n=1 Tax=Timema podura TaxID=61482 RepID=A0ABN7NUN0_TIMPD|nr:unnamed protein product [Timema podura]
MSKTDVFNPQISEEYICPFPGEDESVKDENIDKTSDKVSSAETDSDQDDSDIYPVLLCTPDLQVPTNTVSSNRPYLPKFRHLNRSTIFCNLSSRDGTTRVLSQLLTSSMSSLLVWKWWVDSDFSSYQSLFEDSMRQISTQEENDFKFLDSDQLRSCHSNISEGCSRMLIGNSCKKYKKHKIKGNKRNDAHKNHGEAIELASIKDGVTRVDLMHVCKLCNKCFDSQYSLNYHKIFHSKLKHYMCDYCGIFFVRKVLERHLKVHTDERPFECEECGRTFKEKTILRKHLRIHYGERNYMCELCGKKFVSLENLGVHKYSHLDRAIMKMKCQFCERKFATRQRLKKHIRTHSGERPHLCEVCCRGFSSKSHLERHKLTHTEEKRFYCNYCNYSFIQKGNFKLHTYTKACQPSFDKTKNEDYSSKSKRRDAFLSQVCNCDICGQHFSKKMYLESHLRSHQNNSK